MTSTLVSSAEAGTRPPRGGSTGRLTALDGLRGLAAIVVLLHHTLLALEPHLKPRGEVTPASIWWWLEQTPLKILTAGGEAVVLFFVLSGLVVALPALRGRDFDWAGFLASRFVRILVPAWGALALAVGLILLVPRDPARVASGWLVDNNASTVSLEQLAKEATLSVYSFQIDNVLWSLRWELIFAVLLPVFLLAARALRRVWFPAAVATAALSFAGFAMVDGTLSYLPAFFLGTLMAVNLDRIREAGSAVSARRWFPYVWPIVIGAAVLGIVATWLIRPVVPDAADVSRGFSVLGSVALIAAAIVVPPVARALSGRLCAWLGRISFSLYLVHVPVLVAVAYLVGDSRWALIAPIAIPLSLFISVLFFRWVEKPSHTLARRTGRWIAAVADVRAGRRLVS
ncbi:MAG: acyltransferase [Naasia sp.]